MRFHNIKDRKRWLIFVTVGFCLLTQVSITPIAQGTRGSGPRYEELPNFHQVNAKLYRGGQPRQGGIQRLASIGVDTVINLRDNDERA